jgi:hypothetical protein
LVNVLQHPTKRLSVFYFKLNTLKSCSLLLGFCLLLIPVGCATTTKPKVVHPNAELNVIQKEFDEIVAEVYSRDNEKWHHGAFGNFIIYWNGGVNRGWCHEWQELVYNKIHPTVNSIGWEANKISVGLGTAKEHHVVLIYDSKVLANNSIKANPLDTDAYILDAWYNGGADIYHLEDWLAINDNPKFVYE